jgi:glycosyltransferase involved in cell wall biosynthesis
VEGSRIPDMKIFMIHPHDIEHDPPTIRITSIAREFSKKEHDVTICYFHDDLVHHDKIGKFQIFKDVNIKTINLKRARYSFFSNVKRILYESKGFDIIHIQKAIPYAALPAIYASVFNNIPLHYDWDDNETAIAEDCVPSKFAVAEKQIFESILPFYADTISTASYFLKKKVFEFGFTHHRVFDSPVGADLDLFHPFQDNSTLKNELGLSEKVLLYQGQIDAGNYAKLFVSAASMVINEIPDVSVVLVGGGFRLPETKESAKLAGVDNKILFTGYIRQEEVAKYIAASDVCVATFEANEITVAKSPLKIAEYLASGKPIVASNIGDVPKMIDGAGILVPPGDIKETSKQIIALIKDPDRRKELSVIARKRAEEIYNWARTSGNILQAYKIAIESHKR